jgi:hypothetical protein
MRPDGIRDSIRKGASRAEFDITSYPPKPVELKHSYTIVYQCDVEIVSADAVQLVTGKDERFVLPKRVFRAKGVDPKPDMPVEITLVIWDRGDKTLGYFKSIEDKSRFTIQVADAPWARRKQKGSSDD